jgi:hypothetical protein
MSFYSEIAEQTCQILDIERFATVTFLLKIISP